LYSINDYRHISPVIHHLHSSHTTSNYRHSAQTLGGPPRTRVSGSHMTSAERELIMRMWWGQRPQRGPRGSTPGQGEAEHLFAVLQPEKSVNKFVMKCVFAEKNSSDVWWRVLINHAPASTRPPGSASTEAVHMLTRDALCYLEVVIASKTSPLYEKLQLHWFS